MVMLLHEVWGERKGDGPLYASMCVAGPDGAKHRNTLSPFARILHHFEANSYYEAMVKFHELMKWDAYNSGSLEEKIPYTQIAQMKQQRALEILKP